MLASFFEQDGLDEIAHELILIDNNSSDRTAQLAREFERYQNFRYVFEGQQGLSAARNRGITEARGDIVAFLDDDVIMDRAWLGRLQQCFDETDAGVVGGRSYLIFEESPPGWLGPGMRRNLAEVELGPQRKVLHNGNDLFGLNLSFRKNVLEKHGGFDANLGRLGSDLISGEETALINAIAQSGGTIVYEPQATVGHLVGPDRLQWKYFKKVNLGDGRSIARNEPPASTAVALRKAAESLRDVLVDVGRVAWSRLTMPDSYERRMIVVHMCVMYGMFDHRLRRAFGKGP